MNPLHAFFPPVFLKCLMIALTYICHRFFPESRDHSFRKFYHMLPQRNFEVIRSAKSLVKV